MTTYSAFAEILEYPEESLGELISRFAAELEGEAPEAQAHLLEFQRMAATKSIKQMREIYTAAFDLRPDCTPNLGYHIFGDDARRGVFLAELKARMEARGMELGVELPDHLCLILKYLDLTPEDCPPVIEDCLLPALARMLDVLKQTGSLYEHALRALLSLLQSEHEKFLATAEPMGV